MKSPSEKIRKSPINIGSEHSLGFIIPAQWVKKLSMSTKKEVEIQLFEDRIVIIP